MKTWNDLSPEQREKVLRHIENEQLNALCEIGENYFPEGSPHRAAVSDAVAKAERMQTPWFIHEYLWEDVLIRAAIQQDAETIAQHALYSEGDVNVIDLDAVDRAARKAA